MGRNRGKRDQDRLENWLSRHHGLIWRKSGDEKGEGGETAGFKRVGKPAAWFMVDDGHGSEKVRKKKWVAEKGGKETGQAAREI